MEPPARDSQFVLMRAAALFEARDVQSALSELERIPDADRWSDSRYWVLTAVARQALGENRQAIAAANWALSIEPHNAGLYAMRFDSEREAGLIPEAEKSILEAIRLQPAEVTYQVAYAWLLASAGHLEKAERVNAAARRNAPNYVEAVWQAAELARLQGKDVEAVTAGHQLLGTSAPEPFKHALFGRLLIALDRDTHAVPHLERSNEFAALAGVDPQDVVVAKHWFVRPFRLMLRLGPVATPALLITVAILLLALNLVTAALVVAALIWIVFLYSFAAVPIARLLHRYSAHGRSTNRGHAAGGD